MAADEQETDALASLEERINRAVEAVSYLRKEKETIAEQLQSAMAERDAARKDAALAQAQAQKVAQELEDLRSERKQVRGRIEKLLGQMDLLNVT
ncbi:MAG TPA: cell division protein ZapB [Bryobacteraceae bacterium]|nr:cell division protein ZapB [Bryobacteraceae bacterium]